MGRERIRARRLVPALAALALVLALVQAGPGDAETAAAGSSPSKLEILTRVARVNRKFHVSIMVRCVSPAGGRCIGSAQLVGRGWWVPGAGQFEGVIGRSHGPYSVPAGGRRAVEFKILSYVRRPRDEHAGHHWVRAEFSNMNGAGAKVAKRAVLLRWHRLERPPKRYAH